jgi:hypothetical protein
MLILFSSGSLKSIEVEESLSACFLISVFTDDGDTIEICTNSEGISVRSASKNPRTANFDAQ